MKKVLSIGLSILLLTAFFKKAASQSSSNKAVSPGDDGEATIQRTLCVKFKTGTTREVIQQQMREFLALMDSIPYLLSLQGGMTIQGELKDKPEYDVMYYFTFRNEDDIKKYYYHPAHLHFFEKNGGTWEKFLVVNSRLRP